MATTDATDELARLRAALKEARETLTSLAVPVRGPLGLDRAEMIIRQQRRCASGGLAAIDRIMGEIPRPGRPRATMEDRDAAHD